MGHSPETLDKEFRELVGFILNYGCEDGSHHKQWVLDQILRKLLKSDYAETVMSFELKYSVEWDVGVAP